MSTDIERRLQYEILLLLNEERKWYYNVCEEEHKFRPW